MDSYSKTNQIAFKLLNEMTNAYGVWDESNQEYLATNDIKAAQKKAMELSKQKKDNLFFVVDLEYATGSPEMNNADPLDNQHYSKTVIYSYMNGQVEDSPDMKEEVPQDADEETVDEAANYLAIMKRDRNFENAKTAIMQLASSAFKWNVSQVDAGDILEKVMVDLSKAKATKGPVPRATQMAQTMVGVKKALKPMPVFRRRLAEEEKETKEN